MKQIKRKLLSLLLAGTMLFTLAPAPLALAADNTIYVASTGDDANDGSQGAPYATLDAAYAAAQDHGTITIMDDLALEHSVTFAEDKTINLSSAGGITITYTGEDNINNEGGGLLAILDGSVLLSDLTVQMPLEMAVNGRVLYVGPDGHATLGGGAVLRNGYLAYSGGGVLVDGGSFQMEFGSAVENCYIANNTDCYGGGVAVVNHGFFEMNGGEIAGNSMHTTQGFVSSIVTQLHTTPITLQEAAAYVDAHHRHNAGPKFHKFSVALKVDGEPEPVGVVIASTPKARYQMDGQTLEVNRVCTDVRYADVCSRLYAMAIRAGRELGYRRFLTYTLPSESGSSLRAVGFRPDGETKPSSGWSSPSRPRSTERYPEGAKIRWVLRLT